MIQYLLFDFDGTLVDSKEAFLAGFNQLAAREGFKPILPEEVPYLRTLTIAQRAQYLNFPLYKLPFFTLRFYRLYKQQLSTVTLFPGIKELLQSLAEKGVQPVILSSNSESIIREFLQRQGITAVRDVLTSSRIFGKDKLLNRFLKAKKLAPAQVLYVGDELRDILACQKCGIKVAWVSWGYDAWEVVQPAHPDYVLHTPQQLLEIL
ncbi:HAD-IA family hydrolase [Rufibacter quisquiliarum]|uniref:Phosphoglycolate phosphatase n=1 Tax=Rufibacter quisquiliarum TaxID=1549639 RepID=A0A839GYP4_9BACT|nr:HAD-IA family hydrolase [Rufibacter quisquiliarum]MBA9079816.1 phosphoglycolate phosphatase [Rufibacter quisquiliarum]